MSVLSNNIKCLRLMRGYTQRELAEKLNKSVNAIANWERDVNSPDVDTLETICKILDVTPNQIYGWDKCKELEDFLEKREMMSYEYNQLLIQRQDIENKIKQYAKLFKKS